MSRPRRSAVGSRLGLPSVVGVLVLLLAGCVGLPTDGAVRSGPLREADERPGEPFDYNPDGPRPGAPPIDIVGGYLLAMQATPLRTAVARQFLTDEASTDWVPEESTVIYGSQSLEGRGRTVRMELEEIVELDGRGAWLGDTSDGNGIRARMVLVRERGQWRITNPPDALAVPRSHFETRFAQFFLYFFDPTAQVLVPEPVYLPLDEQASTLLVRGLLRGPDDRLQGATRTFLPRGIELDDLSVVVSRDGTAEVPLSDEILDLDDEALDRVLGQLGWTLRQIPGVQSMRIVVDGSPLDVVGSGVNQDVHGWPELDPAVNWASQELFGLREGRVVTLSDDDESRIGGPFGSRDLGLRSIAVDLPAEQVAGVSSDGSRVLVTPRARESGQPDAAAAQNVVYSGGTNLLRPAWDSHGQAWLIDRRRDGATVSVVRSGTTTPVAVAGITGEDVKSFLLSRDGTRLVAVVAVVAGSRDDRAVAGSRGDRLVVARVMRDGRGVVRRVGASRSLPVGVLQVGRIRDLAWRTPGSLALLTGPTRRRSQVVVVPIDGSSALGDVATNAEIFRNEAVQIVTSPAPGAPVYVGTRDRQLYELGANGQWTGAGIPDGLASPTFVG